MVINRMGRGDGVDDNTEVCHLVLGEEGSGIVVEGSLVDANHSPGLAMVDIDHGETGAHILAQGTKTILTSSNVRFTMGEDVFHMEYIAGAQACIGGTVDNGYMSAMLEGEVGADMVFRDVDSSSIDNVYRAYGVWRRRL